MLGLIFGPLALLVVLAIGRRDRGTRLDGRLRYCPGCAELIQARARRCRHCGEESPPEI